MVTMVTKQKIFDQLYLLWDIQGWIYILQNFTFPGQGSYEITGGSALPPPPPPLVSDVVPKPLVSEGLTAH